MSHSRFLGREYFDERTQMWMFKDGSGALPKEMEIDIRSKKTLYETMSAGGGILLLMAIWDWKDRLKSTTETKCKSIKLD